jgi:hypothetical protein
MAHMHALQRIKCRVCIKIEERKEGRKDQGKEKADAERDENKHTNNPPIERKHLTYILHLM